MKNFVERNKFHQFKKLKNLSIEFRRNDTEAEQKFWEIVRAKRFKNLKFLRQKIIGEFVLDFYCHELKLGIEIDGKVHEDLKERDSERDNYLRKNFNVKIIRIKNNFILKSNKEEIINYLNKIIQMI